MAANISPKTRSNRELSSRQRLHQISHHFLSDAEPTAPSVETHTDNTLVDLADNAQEQLRQPFVLPILMSLQQENYFPVYALSQAMLAHKKSAAVLLVEGELSSTTSTTVFELPGNDTYHHSFERDDTAQRSANQNPFRHLLQQTGFQHSPDVYLIPIASINSPYVESVQKLLIPVQASLDGIRSAYLHLKRLAVLKQEMAVGIIMLKTDDPSWAQRCFNKLALAARQFLSCTITSYGYLPDTTYPESLNSQLLKNTQGLPHEMIEIADMLLSDLEAEPQDTEELVLEETANTSVAGMPWA